MKKIYYLAIGLNIIFNNVVMSQNKPAWKLTNEFPGGAKMGIALMGDSIVMVSLKNGVIKSTNKGETFQQVLTSGETFCINTDSKGNIYVGGRGMVYVSTYEGNGWDSTHVETDIPFKMFVEHPDSGIFAINNELNDSLEYVGSGVLCSTDFGQTWKKKNNGLGNNVVCERITIDQDGKMYLAVADDKITGVGGLYVSENAGNSWRHISIIVDGRGIINNNVKVQYTHGLSVSLNDTLYYSFEGSAGGYVALNLKISTQDLLDNKQWQVYSSDTSIRWYMNSLLQNQFFASDKSVFSSSIGTLNQGKSFVKLNGKDYWDKFDAGLGIGETGFREPQHFIEVQNTILMIQEYDERIYQLSLETDTPVVSIPEASIPEFAIWPNPVAAGSEIHYTWNINSDQLIVNLYSLTGNSLSQISCDNRRKIIRAPNRAGMYLLKIQNDEFYSTIKLLVY